MYNEYFPFKKLKKLSIFPFNCWHRGHRHTAPLLSGKFHSFFFYFEDTFTVHLSPNPNMLYNLQSSF